MTIAGSDPSGGAGIQADLKTFHQFGVYGEAIITLLTVQNTVAVRRVECVRADLLEQQIEAVFEDIPPHAVKTGALGNCDLIKTVVKLAAHWICPVVVDPVMISKHGACLLSNEAEETLRTALVPRATLLTPNLAEASRLTGVAVENQAGMRRAAERLIEMGAKAVLVKGGHLCGDPVDILFDGTEWSEFPAPRVPTVHTHGTGCTYSAAITAELAKGASLREAVARAKVFITEAIRTNPGLGGGSGPVNHHAIIPGGHWQK